MSILLTTTGTGTYPLVIDDLAGASIPHPTSNLDLEIDFSFEEIRDSADLEAALSAGDITIVDNFGRSISSLAELDDNQGIEDLADTTLDFSVSTAVITDDGKYPYYDFNQGKFVTDDAVTHGTVIIDCIKSTAGTITKGFPVYLAGFASDLHQIELANATSSATMPVIGFTAESITDSASGHVITFGKLQNVDLTTANTTLNPLGQTWAVNDELFVHTAAGGLTNVRPSGATTKIQRIAQVLKAGATGQLFIYNTARTAGLPNLTSDYVWKGNDTNQPVEIALADLPVSNATNTELVFLQNQIDLLTPSNQLISGGVSYSGSGLTYDVTALEYRIQGTIYTTAATQVTLAAADPTFDRIDLIIADDSQTVSVITGTPAATPQKPGIDSLTQLEVTFILVPAAATTPNVNIELIYDENVGTGSGEWNATTTVTGTNLGDTADPYTGTTHISMSAGFGSQKNITFTPASAYTIVDGTVTFRMKPTVDMTASLDAVFVGFFVGGSLVGNSVTIGGTSSLTYGLDPADTTQYQLVSIPIGAFGGLPTTVDDFRFFRAAGNGTAEFSLDKVQIEEGVSGTVTPGLPSLTNGYIWVGDNNDVAQEVATTSHVSAGTLTSWTLDAGNVYYQDFVHGLGTFDIAYEIYDTATNESVMVDKLDRTDNNTVRVYIVGNTASLRIVVWDAIFGFQTQNLWQGTSQSTTYNAVNGDVVLADATSGSFTVNLPAAASNNNARIDIKKIDSSANTVTVDGDGSETIDGALTAVLTTQWEAITVFCNGTAWFILAA